MKTQEVMDRAKAKLGVDSDGQLAKALGWATAKASQYRTGKQLPANTEARQLAEAAGVPWPEFIASLEIERAKDEQTATAWGKALASLRRSAAVLVLAVLASLAALQMPDTSSALAALLFAALTIIFIMSIWRYLKALKTASAPH